MTNKQTLITTASAKAILLGEHAVVYGQPALAVPVRSIRARATISPGTTGVRIHALNLNKTIALESSPTSRGDRALITAVRSTLNYLGIEQTTIGVDIEIQSGIPIASGMGSGAAVAIAIIRALFAWNKQPAPPKIVSSLAYQSETILHGKPSGIDNTVIAYEMPVCFAQHTGITQISVGEPLYLVIGYTGISSQTRDTVHAVQQAHRKQRREYESWFHDIGQLVSAAQICIAEGDTRKLGTLMNENHRILCQLDVSCPSLDALVLAAKQAGAIGAKMSGGGRGGIMIALATHKTSPDIAKALARAGAVQTIETIVPESGAGV